MNNTELCKHYIEQKISINTIQNVPEKSIFDILDESFNKNWTWEISDEKFYADNSAVCTTVTLYIPGRVLTGRSFCKLKDYPTNHERAISNACLRLMETNPPQLYQSVSPLLDSEMAKSQNMTPEQIMESLSQTASLNLPDTNTQPNISSFPEIGNPEVSQNNITLETAVMPTTPPPQIQPINSQANTQQPIQEPPNGVYGPDDPQPRYKGCSQNQMDGIKQFKTDFDILNDDMFNNYIKTWDKKLKTKADLTAANVDSFLKWIDSLGKMDC